MIGQKEELLKAVKRRNTTLYSKEVDYFDTLNPQDFLYEQRYGTLESFINGKKDTLFFHKSKDWEYEQEYRVISTKKNPKPLNVRESLVGIIQYGRTQDEFLNSIEYKVLSKIDNILEFYRYSTLLDKGTLYNIDGEVNHPIDYNIEAVTNDFKGTLSGTFKNSKTEVSINVSFKSVGDKIYTVSGTIERNGKDAEITVNGEKCLIHKHQVPPYRSNPTQPIPKANPTQQSNFMRIFSLLYQISALDQPLEGFTKVEESYFIYENVKVLDGDGNVEGILNGKTKGGAYLNITYEEAKGGINTIISFFEDTAPKTFVIFINGEACTVTLG